DSASPPRRPRSRTPSPRRGRSPPRRGASPRRDRSVSRGRDGRVKQRDSRASDKGDNTRGKKDEAKSATRIVHISGLTRNVTAAHLKEIIGDCLELSSSERPEGEAVADSKEEAGDSSTRKEGDDAETSPTAADNAMKDTDDGGERAEAPAA